jgi:hypothetical protein
LHNTLLAGRFVFLFLGLWLLFELRPRAAEKKEMKNTINGSSVDEKVNVDLSSKWLPVRQMKSTTKERLQPARHEEQPFLIIRSLGYSDRIVPLQAPVYSLGQSPWSDIHIPDLEGELFVVRQNGIYSLRFKLEEPERMPLNCYKPNEQISLIIERR